MKLLLFIAVLAALPALSPAATYFVPDDFGTIQEAFNAAAAGDAIIVRPGVYYENIDFMGKAVTLRSEYGPYVTIIDGNGMDRVEAAMSDEGPGTILEEFLIRIGTAPFGGGILYAYSSPTIRGNVIRENKSTPMAVGSTAWVPRRCSRATCFSTTAPTVRGEGSAVISAPPR